MKRERRECFPKQQGHRHEGGPEGSASLNFKGNQFMTWFYFIAFIILIASALVQNAITKHRKLAGPLKNPQFRLLLE